MAKLLCGFAALCSVWIHTTVAVLREVRSGPRVRQPENEGGSGPYGNDGIPEPGDDVVVPVGGETTEPPEWEELMPRFTPEQDYALTFNTSGEDNLCLHDHFVPELVVIGAMASGTVSFNLALAYSPSLVWPHRRDKRKWYPTAKLHHRRGPVDGPIDDIDVVDTTGPNQGNGDGWNFGQGHYFDLMYDKGRDSTGRGYPPCTRAKRVVAVDSTSRYALDPYVPGNIAAWYGVTMGPRLKFVYILRDPLERLHAHYWKANKERWCKQLPKYGFADFLRGALSGKAEWFMPKPPTPEYEKWKYFEHRCQEIIGASLYTKHFRLWFHSFDSGQFTIIPFHYITAGHPRPGPAVTLWKQLGVNGLTPPQVHANAAQDPHPALEDEMNPELTQQFWVQFSQFMGAEDVAGALTNTSAILYGFDGERTTVRVSRWLQNNW